jgi:hypothetical protein
VPSIPNTTHPQRAMLAVFAASLIQPAPRRHAAEQRVVGDERRLVVKVGRHEDCQPHKDPARHVQRRRCAAA